MNSDLQNALEQEISGAYIDVLQLAYIPHPKEALAKFISCCAVLV
jgi:hypothetical protein